MLALSRWGQLELLVSANAKLINSTIPDNNVRNSLKQLGMYKLLLSLFLSNVFFANAQSTKFNEVSIFSGLRIQPKCSFLQTTSSILGVEKRFNFENESIFKIQYISLYVNITQNQVNWQSSRLGSRLLIYRNLQYLPIYFISDFHINFQNTAQRNNQDLGFANVLVGIGCVINKKNQFELSYGSSENSSMKPPYLEITYRKIFFITKKIKRKHLTKCPN